MSTSLSTCRYCRLLSYYAQNNEKLMSEVEIDEYLCGWRVGIGIVYYAQNNEKLMSEVEIDKDLCGWREEIAEQRSLKNCEDYEYWEKIKQQIKTKKSWNQGNV